MIHAKIGRVSYTSAGNQAWGDPFLLISGNLQKTCTPSANHQPRTPALPRRLCGQNLLENTLPLRLNFPRFLTKVLHFHWCIFPGTFFALFCLFLSGQEPKNRNATLWRKMQHLRGPFRVPRRSAERPSLNHRNDELESPAEAGQNGRVRAFPPACASQRAHMKASQNGGELSYILSNDNTAASPQSGLLQRRRQFPFLAHCLCSYPKSGLHPRPTSSNAKSPKLFCKRTRREG